MTDSQAGLTESTVFELPPATSVDCYGRPTAMADPDEHPMATHVLFVCIQNSGRSQMSQAFFDSAAAAKELSARSAGTSPARQVDPTVVGVMAELGHDLSSHKPSPLTTELAEWADLVVTMGCGDACPYVPGTRYVDWDLRDPGGLPPEEVRLIRDEIRERVETLIIGLSGHGSPPEPEALR